MAEAESDFNACFKSALIVVVLLTKYLALERDDGECHFNSLLA